MEKPIKIDVIPYYVPSDAQCELIRPELLHIENINECEHPNKVLTESMLRDILVMELTENELLDLDFSDSEVAACMEGTERLISELAAKINSNFVKLSNSDANVGCGIYQRP